MNETSGNKICKEFPNQCQFVKTDVAKEEDCKNAIDFTVEKFKQIHVVVNSAGVASGQGLVGVNRVLDTKEFLRV